MIEIDIPTLKDIAKNLKGLLNNSDYSSYQNFSTSDLLTIVAKSHGYINPDAVPRNKIEILNKISKNLDNAFIKIKYNTSIKLTSSSSINFVSRMYGYRDYNTFLAKINETPFSKMLSELDFYEKPILFRKHGYKENHEDWSTLPIIYIHVRKPVNESFTKIASFINATSGVKLLNEIENDKFFSSYNSENNKWPTKLDKEKDIILKFTNYRLSSDLLNEIQKKFKKRSTKFEITYTENDIETRLLEIIDSELYSSLEEQDIKIDNLYNKLNPYGYIIKNKYFDISHFNDPYYDDYSHHGMSL
ncbi:MAG: hypothetical protein DRG78_12740 [Epsilonproteobacteria bacterium]|nr:MAG: hypothetical protein DRG78_12740 [Campylobacterota bacterium]